MDKFFDKIILIGNNNSFFIKRYERVDFLTLNEKIKRLINSETVKKYPMCVFCNKLGCECETKTLTPYEILKFLTYLKIFNKLKKENAKNCIIINTDKEYNQNSKMILNKVLKEENFKKEINTLKPYFITLSSSKAYKNIIRLEKKRGDLDNIMILNNKMIKLILNRVKLINKRLLDFIYSECINKNTIVGVIKPSIIITNPNINLNLKQHNDIFFNKFNYFTHYYINLISPIVYDRDQIEKMLINGLKKERNINKTLKITNMIDNINEANVIKNCSKYSKSIINHEELLIIPEKIKKYNNIYSSYDYNIIIIRNLYDYILLRAISYEDIYETDISIQKLNNDIELWIEMINILKNQKETEYQNVIINIDKLNNRKYFDTINKKLNYRMDYTFFNYKTHEDQLFQENHYQIKEYQLDLIKKLLTNEELLFLNKKYFNITDKFILSIQNITID